MNGWKGSTTHLFILAILAIIEYNKNKGHQG